MIDRFDTTRITGWATSHLVAAGIVSAAIGFFLGVLLF